MPRLGILPGSASILIVAAATLSFGALGSAAARPEPGTSASILRASRSSPSDLEVGGDVAGLPAGSVRYMTREDLLALPQVSYTVTADPNFKGLGPTRVSGVSLAELAKRFAAPDATLVVAICDDKYRANYPRDYRPAHHPLLVLEINGKGPGGWPKDEGSDMGPYLISQPNFTPRFKVLSHVEEMQIPWGVVRIDFRNEKQVFGAIAPRGPHADDPEVRDGYRIVKENCFRCHNQGDEGGHKAGVTWTVISAIATSSPDFFAEYVRNPQSKNPRAQMPGNPEYDGATLHALAAYFRTFAAPANSSGAGDNPGAKP
ncbi:MAG TPA: c-type cytochrome [Candidatus Acidoferrales bacterium]|jgi:mono/diheme cytochrome c family protein|nr:c-type cytochrome [Candidatus Acidoferrales bacterium]